VYVQHAVQLMDSTLYYYKTSGPNGQTLFHETYPKRNTTVSYLAGKDTVEYERVAYLWTSSGMLSGVNALLEATGDDNYARLLESTVVPAIECYYDTTRAPRGFQSYPIVFGHFDRYYDDNMWIGQQMIKSYELTGNVNYLNYAETIWKFIETGRDSVLGGGIYWCEQKKVTKNTCSNAPAATMALMLYKVTSDEKYLEAGKDLYNWVKNHLRDWEDGLYFDRINLDGTIEKGKYTYNSGQMLQAASLLYRATGDNAYLEDAQILAKACSSYFFKTCNTDEKPVRILKNGHVWFAAVMLRGFVELYSIDGNPTYINDYKTTLDRLWENGRDAKGLFEDERFNESTRFGSNDKLLLTQMALVEMYARLSGFR